MPRKPPEKPNKPPEKDDDWSVEWPDGSWLTWNEETGTWDKQEAPKGRAKSSPSKPTTPSKAEAASSSASAKKTPTKTTKTRAKPKASPTKAPVDKAGAGEAVGSKPSAAPAAAGSSPGWRPQAERGAPVVPVERSTQIRQDRSHSVPPRAQPIRREEDRWPVSAIAAGAVAGVTAGYLLTFLVP